jgi:hypothetical protein
MLGGFTGTFDGKGYNVDNLVMPSGGIFNYITHDGVFKNVTFTNAVLDATNAPLLQRGFITDWCNGAISNVYVQFKEVKVASEAYTFYGGAHTSEPVIKNVMVVADKITNTAGGTVKFSGIGYADKARSFIGNVVNSVFVTGSHAGVTTLTGYKEAGTLSGEDVPAEEVATTASTLADLDEEQSNWAVVERSVPEEYKVTVQKNGGTFSIINTHKSNQEIPDSPQTGDTSNITLYIMLMCISGIMLIVLGIYNRRHKEL